MALIDTSPRSTALTTFGASASMTCRTLRTERSLTLSRAAAWVVRLTANLPKVANQVRAPWRMVTSLPGSASV
jgi:hypothetical protein